MQVRRVRDVYIKSICLYVFVSCKESTKRRQSAWTGVTSRQNHRLGIVWTKSSKSTANRSHLSTCIPRTLPLTSPSPPPKHTDQPSSGTYLETYVFAESSTPVSGNDYRTKYGGNRAIEKSERPGRTSRDSEMLYLLNLCRSTSYDYYFNYYLHTISSLRSNSKKYRGRNVRNILKHLFLSIYLRTYVCINYAPHLREWTIFAWLMGIMLPNASCV